MRVNPARADNAPVPDAFFWRLAHGSIAARLGEQPRHARSRDEWARLCVAELNAFDADHAALAEMAPQPGAGGGSPQARLLEVRITRFADIAAYALRADPLSFDDDAVTEMLRLLSERVPARDADDRPDLDFEDLHAQLATPPPSACNPTTPLAATGRRRDPAVLRHHQRTVAPPRRATALRT